MTLSGLISDSGTRGDYTIARKVLDAMEAEGKAVVQMIKDAGQVGRHSRGAVSPVVSAREAGRNLDVTG